MRCLSLFEMIYISDSNNFVCVIVVYFSTTYYTILIVTTVVVFGCWLLLLVPVQPLHVLITVCIMYYVHQYAKTFTCVCDLVSRTRCTPLICRTTVLYDIDALTCKYSLYSPIYSAVDRCILSCIHSYETKLDIHNIFRYSKLILYFVFFTLLCSMIV
jgi:hypothetical protein